jgi:drug/metabolite transporter (DMT)-like permease
MDPFVFAAVLFAAACHAGWNATIKLGLDPFSAMALIAVAAGVMALPVLPVTGLPSWEAWPWVLASVALHLAYYIGLTEAYRAGEMGQVYPIARGTAPLITAVMTALVLGEELGSFGYLGIAILATGVFMISLRGGRDLAKLDRRAVAFALFTAVTISGYSLVDGVGARVAGNAHAYTAALFALDGLSMLLFALVRRGGGFVTDVRRSWRPGLAGGALSLIAYWIAIWAMTVAPIAIVAAVRETSVLFAAIIAVVVLGEKVRPIRIAAAVLIVIGLALMRLH